MPQAEISRPSSAVCTVLILAALLSGCETGSQEGPSQGGPGPIDWSDPIPGGRAFPSVADAQAYVGFPLVVPRLQQAPEKIVVQDADVQADPHARWVAMVFDLPAAGTILLMETKASYDESALLAPVERSSFPAGTFSSVPIGEATGLLTQGNGVGRVQWIRDGVLLDLTGPRVTPAQAVRLASEV